MAAILLKSQCVKQLKFLSFSMQETVRSQMMSYSFWLYQLNIRHNACTCFNYEHFPSTTWNGVKPQYKHTEMFHFLTIPDY